MEELVNKLNDLIRYTAYLQGETTDEKAKRELVFFMGSLITLSVGFKSGTAEKTVLNFKNEFDEMLATASDMITAEKEANMDEDILSKIDLRDLGLPDNIGLN